MAGQRLVYKDCSHKQLAGWSVVSQLLVSRLVVSQLVVHFIGLRWPELMSRELKSLITVRIINVTCR